MPDLPTKQSVKVCEIFKTGAIIKGSAKFQTAYQVMLSLLSNRAPDARAKTVSVRQIPPVQHYNRLVRLRNENLFRFGFRLPAGHGDGNTVHQEALGTARFLARENFRRHEDWNIGNGFVRRCFYFHGKNDTTTITTTKEGFDGKVARRCRNW